MTDVAEHSRLGFDYSISSLDSYICSLTFGCCITVTKVSTWHLNLSLAMLNILSLVSRHLCL